MLITLESTYSPFFVVSAASGAASDADSLPTCAVYEGTTTTPILTPTVVKVATGLYYVSLACTSNNGFEAAKTYNVVVSATVGGAAAKAVIDKFVCWNGSLDSVTLANGQLNAVLDAISASDTTINQILTNLGTANTNINDLADLVAGIYQDTHVDGVKISDGNLIEGSINIRQALAEMLAMLVGIIVKNGDTYTIKNPAGDADRAVIVTDGNGSRTSVTLTPPA